VGKYRSRVSSVAARPGPVLLWINPEYHALGNHGQVPSANCCIDSQGRDRLPVPDHGKHPMLMCASDRRVHRQRPIDQPLCGRLRGERRQHLVAGAFDRASGNFRPGVPSVSGASPRSTTTGHPTATENATRDQGSSQNARPLPDTPQGSSQWLRVRSAFGSRSRQRAAAHGRGPRPGQGRHSGP
jgi:hypothetical protein